MSDKKYKRGRPATGCKSDVIGKNIRKFREQRGLSQEQLAEGIYSVQMISKIETGKANPRVKKLEKVAERLQVPLHEIYRPAAEDEFPNQIKLDMVETFMLRGELEPALEMLCQLAQQADLIEVERQRWGLLQGKAFNRSGKPEQAVEVLRPLVERLDIDKKADDKTLCSLYNTLGTSYFQLQDFTNAYWAYKRGYQISLAFPEFDSLSAQVVYNLGMVCNKMELLAEARVHLEAAREYYGRVSNLKNLAHSYFELAYATKGEHYAREALSLYRNLDCVLMAHRVRQYYAYAVESKRDYQKALEELQSVALDFEKEGDRARSLNSFVNAVTVSLEHDDLNSAKRYIAFANECKEEVGEGQEFFLAEYYKATAKYHLQTKSYDLCIRDAEESSERYTKMGLYADSSDALELVAKALHSKGMHEEAGMIWGRALECMRKVKRGNGQ